MNVFSINPDRISSMRGKSVSRLVTVGVRSIGLCALLTVPFGCDNSVNDDQQAIGGGFQNSSAGRNDVVASGSGSRASGAELIELGGQVAVGANATVFGDQGGVGVGGDAPYDSGGAQSVANAGGNATYDSGDVQPVTDAGDNATYDSGDAQPAVEAGGDATYDSGDAQLEVDASAIADDASSTQDDAGPTLLPALDDQTPTIGSNGIRIDEMGLLWIADLFGSQIVRINPPPDMKIVERYGEAQGIKGPDDLLIDEHFVYWAGYFDGIVGKLDRQSGQNSVIANTGAGTNPIEFDNNGMLLVGVTQLGTGLFEVDPAGKTAPRTLGADVDSNAFALAPDGFLYGPSWDTVIKIDVTTGTFEKLVDGFAFACSVRYNPLDGYLYVLDTLPPSLYRVALDGSLKQVFVALSEDYFADNFAITKDGTFLVTRFLNPIVTRVSADGATIEDFSIGQ